MQGDQSGTVDHTNRIRPQSCCPGSGLTYRSPERAKVAVNMVYMDYVVKIV